VPEFCDLPGEESAGLALERSLLRLVR